MNNAITCLRTEDYLGKAFYYQKNGKLCSIKMSALLSDDLSERQTLTTIEKEDVPYIK